MVSTGHVSNPNHFHLIGAFTKDPRHWRQQPWTDIYIGDGITTGRVSGGRVVRVKPYGDVLREYRNHPEAKSADSDGKPCGSNTKGLLQCRHVHVGKIVCISKESNLLEEVEGGTRHDWDEVLNVYEDPRQDPFVTDVIPILHRVTAERLARRARCSASTIKYLRNGHRRPSPRIRKRLTRVAVEWARRTGRRKRADPDEHADGPADIGVADSWLHPSGLEDFQLIRPHGRIRRDSGSTTCQWLILRICVPRLIINHSDGRSWARRRTDAS